MLNIHDIIDPSGISDAYDSLDLQAVSRRLLILSTKANQIATAWMVEDKADDNSNRHTITWNNFLVPGGQLMFRAADLKGFQSSSRLQNIANQWTESAVRNGGFSQYGNGFYPKRGDNWTSGRFAMILIDTYIYKIQKHSMRRRSDLNLIQDCAFVFEQIGNLVAADRTIGG